MKTLEERIVRLVKTTTDGENQIEEAELRQFVVKTGTYIPDYIKVVPARFFGVQLTMQWDESNKHFTTTTDDGSVWVSDFDFNKYLPSSWDTAVIARSPRRGRQASSEEHSIARG